MRISKKKFQRKLKQLIKKYVTLLKLNDWEIEVVISKSDHVTFKRGKIRSEKANYYADVIYKYILKYASLTLTRLQTVDRVEELEDTIFHELLHIKFAPLIETSETLINLAGLKKEKATALLCELDEREHELIETFIRLTNSKKRGK